MYTLKQLVDFGNYLFEQYGVMVFSSDGKNTPLYKRQVTDADISNFECERENILPSKYQIGDEVKLCFENTDIDASVISVHFTASKVKYDLQLKLGNDDNTRIYNVDSCYVI